MLRQNQSFLKCATDTCEIRLGIVKQVLVEAIHCVDPKNKMCYLAHKLHFFWLHKILYFRRKHAFKEECRLLGFFYPEDGGDTFLRNVSSYKIHMAHIPEDGILHSHAVKTSNPTCLQSFEY
jgi:hypothetical protein